MFSFILPCVCIPSFFRCSYTDHSENLWKPGPRKEKNMETCPAVNGKRSIEMFFKNLQRLSHIIRYFQTFVTYSLVVFVQQRDFHEIVVIPTKTTKHDSPGRSWGALGGTFGRSWPLLGRSWPLLDPSWALLGRSWNSMQKLSENRCQIWPIWTPQSLPKCPQDAKIVKTKNIENT